MIVGYIKQTWAAGSAGGTPLSPTRLAHIEDGISAAAMVADLALPQTGGTLTGDLLMAGHRVTGLADPALAQDAATRAYVLQVRDALINGAPGLLDTLGEIAAQLGVDESAVAALTTAVNARLAMSTYDANSIVKADADDTPVVLPVPSSTLIGRGASGVITALTVAQVKALLVLSSADLSDVASLATTTALSAAIASEVTARNAAIAAQHTADNGAFPSKTQVLLGSRRSLPKTKDVDAVMASPATIGALTTTIPTGGVLVEAVRNLTTGFVAPVLGQYTYRGAGSFTIRGTTFPDNAYIKATSLTSPGVSSAPHGVIVNYWAADSGATSVFAFYLKGTGGPVRIKIDGELISATPTTITGGGAQYYLPITGLAAGHHRITIDGDTSFSFGGVVRGPIDTLETATLRGPRAIVIGDSFTEGTGAAAGAASNWVRRLGERLGIDDMRASGVGSTGYLYPSTGGKVKFRDRAVNDWQSQNPDILIYAGGINDWQLYLAADIGTEVAALLAADRAALPNVVQIVLSPFWRNGVSTFPSGLMDARDAIKAAAQAAPGYGSTVFYVDMLEMPLDGTAQAGTLSNSPGISATTFQSNAIFAKQMTVEIGTGSTRERRVITNVSGAGPYTYTVTAFANAHTSGQPVTQVGPCHWTGTGRSGAKLGDGNSDVFVGGSDGSDPTHPTQAGHEALGDVVASLIARTVLPA